MTLKEFREWLSRIEHAYPVYEWHVDGLQVWPMIRLVIHGANFFGRSEGYFVGAGSRAYTRVLVRALSNWSRAAIADRAHNERPDDPADAIFLAYSVGRQPLIDGRRYNPLLAPYVELLKRRGLRSRVWEMSPHGDYNVPRHTPSAFVQPWMIMSRGVSLVRPGIRFEESLPTYQGLSRDAEEAGLDFPYRNRDRLHRDVYGIRALAKTFTRWLRRARPSVVFVADASLREQALCVACRQLGITSVELQHGVQERNPIYADWNAVPATGLTSRARVFWTWDQTSAQAIQSWASGASAAHSVVVGGDPWLDMWLSSENRLAATLRADLQARRHAVGGTKHILVTLSSVEEILPEVVAGAVRKSPPDWRWWFRMHPVHLARRRKQARAVVESLGGDADLMDFATEVPLFALLQVMDAHVTVGSSTVVQQAAAIGVPSVGCTPAVADLFAAEIARDMLRVATTTDALLLALGELVTRPRRPSLEGRPDGDAAMGIVLGVPSTPAVGP
jgi:hypothetical protein